MELVLQVSTLVGVAFIAVILIIHSRRISKVSKKQHLPIERSNVEVFQVVVDITFDEIMCVNTAPEKIKEKQFKSLNGEFKAAGLGLQVADVVVYKDAMLGKFQNVVKAAIDTKSAVVVKTKDGAEILVARDLKTGQLLGPARKISPNLHKATQIANLAIGAAHIISGYDNAKKLKVIDKKIDKIIALRRTDMVAELKSIYEALQRMAYVDKMGLDTIIHLRNLQHRLTCLRNSWIDEVVNGLEEDVDDPTQRSWFKKLFSINKNTVKRVSGQIETCLEPLYITRTAIELERMIALSLGEEDVFEEVTLRNIKSNVAQAAVLVRERREWLNKYINDDGEQLELLIEGTENFVKSLDKAA